MPTSEGRLKLEDLRPDLSVRGIAPEAPVSVVSAEWHGSDALTLIYRLPSGRIAEEILYRHDEARLEAVQQGRPWRFDGDGAAYRLVAEARRIRLAHLFDPVLAVHTSLVEPLPHQITAVYEAMLPRRPLRFLLADDPGAGKTIMAGLLVKELIARGDLERCLVVCPGSLAEQWQDELYRRFHLPFEILTGDKADAARTGNWFLENDLAIARLDKLARNEDLQAKLRAPDCRYDLVVCDEAHKMSATFFGGEIRYTRRYRLGQLLSGLTRHFLLMTATPHNGKEEDFQLFLALLDGDRFEGRFRDGVHRVEVSDLMRRMVKEHLLKFDGRPLFPERIAYSVPYRLSDAESQLYGEITAYVREEFNRAEALQNDRRAGTVGFALTVLQRRLASSPEAIYQSLRRRRERLESRLREPALLERGGRASAPAARGGRGPVRDARGATETHGFPAKIAGVAASAERAARGTAKAHGFAHGGPPFDVEDPRPQGPGTRPLEPVGPLLDAEDVEDLDDAPGDEVEAAEAAVLDQATAASTIAELGAEIASLQRLETLAGQIRRSGADTKWRELSNLLSEIFTPAGLGAGGRVAEEPAPYGSGAIPPPEPSPRQKLVLFTEHRDTLDYLQRRIGTLLGRPEAIAAIHGGMGRAERRKAQEAFLHDPRVRILLATDAAGEGINLQRAHLMVNYDLPWNPNRLEQRFGRIHRIGQSEVCHLWNLVAEETREGDVYRRLLDKLEQARHALGGQVFDVLGKLRFEGRSLRDLLIEAVRYGDRPEVRARLSRAVGQAVDRPRLQALIEERALARDAMDSRRVARVREDMERAEAHRLQPHYVESFFLEAFRRLGGAVRQREPRRYEITHVPALVRNRDRRLGIGEPVLKRYERIAFDKALLAPPAAPPPHPQEPSVVLLGARASRPHETSTALPRATPLAGRQPPAAFLCPGHPLLDAVLDLTLERGGDLLRRGTILVDERAPGLDTRVLFALEHDVRDAGPLPDGEGRTISRRMLYVEIDAAGNAHRLHHAPYLDYRPLAEDEPPPADLLARPECAWITRELEERVRREAIAHVVPEHVTEVRERRLAWIGKTRAAVKERLTKEIAWWDHRANQLEQTDLVGRRLRTFGPLRAGRPRSQEERAGKAGARLNSGEARRRADDLQERLERRMAQLDREARISALPPAVVGGLVVVPMGLIAAMTGGPEAPRATDTRASAARARAVVMDVERRLGFDPVDREPEKLGYDVESRVPGTGRLRFIEVKGRVAGADRITVTKNEILTALNKPEDFILAIVVFPDEGEPRVRYVRGPFEREPDFGAVSVNYKLDELLARGEAPG